MMEIKGTLHIIYIILQHKIDHKKEHQSKEEQKTKTGNI